jgi:hypothetical protein
MHQNGQEAASGKAIRTRVTGPARVIDKVVDQSVTHGIVEMESTEYATQDGNAMEIDATEKFLDAFRVALSAEPGDIGITVKSAIPGAKAKPRDP